MKRKIFWVAKQCSEVHLFSEELITFIFRVVE
jgi:hypothetical protein